MIHTDFDTDTLARYLHISPVQVQKLAERGNVPGRKIGGQWRVSKGGGYHLVGGRNWGAGGSGFRRPEGNFPQGAAPHQTAAGAKHGRPLSGGVWVPPAAPR